METQIKEFKLTFWDLLFTGWRLFRRNFKKILIITLIVQIPIYYLYSFVPHESFIIEYGANGEKLSDLVYKIFNFFFGIISVIAIAIIIENSINEKVITWKEALRISFSKWFDSIKTGFLVQVIILGLLLLFIIPGMIWSIYYSFWIYVIALRNIKGKPALDYSKGLVIDQWWSVWGTFLGIDIIGIIFAVIVGLIIQSPLLVFPDYQINSQLLYLIGELFNSLFFVIGVTYFLNLDYRRNKTFETTIEKEIAIDLI